ncbi:pyridine nucleotide-disulfide oxidoreductase [Bacteroidia bacterium]|nr:pyridine nucleotide-disulfide oxidoreductase [Bacteroidia bacterium]
MNKFRLLVAFTSVCLICSGQSTDVFLEAESFADKGGWVLDQQFMDQMGSPYLMAHGLGKVVADARTTVEFPETGTYHLWVRTFNWTAPWYKGAGPGQFKVKINGKAHSVVLGNTGTQWMWQDAGKVSIKNKQTEIALQDLTGFNGRCDAIFFTKDKSFVPPSDIQTLSDFRRNKLNITVQDAGHYDLVVVGGGVAGVCAAVTAAQLGVKVALINDRPVLGGNSSSEVRVGISGGADANLYPNIGNVLKKILMKKHFNGGPAEAYTDSEKATLVKNTPNLDLFPNLHVFKTEMNQTTITAVVARHIENSAEFRFEATYFADCTGDATVGYLAGADYRMGRESAYEAFESLAPRIADNAMTGTSNLWSYETVDTPSSFPILEWACQFNPDFYIESDKDWRWEGGFSKNTITDAENIRDQNFRAIFGNWSYLKNNNPKFANRQISWLAYLAGKRESRRLLGDVILNQNDILTQIKYNDASFTTTWSLDLHYPDWKASKYFPGEEFFSYCEQTPIYPYHVPYRCLYSRNINNLFMAGRNISVTHVAFSTIRVQVTTGMMGEVVGMAASVCKKHEIMPRQVYTEHLADLKTLMKAGVTLTSNQ